MLKKTEITVFDFDGTLSASDCNLEFGKYCFAHSLRPWLFLPVVIFGMLCRYINPAGIWWRGVSRIFVSPGLIRRLVPGFVAEHKKRRFEWVTRTVAAERAAGRMAVLISAGPDYLIPKLVDDIKFDAIITSKNDPTQPWKLKFLCWGKNKVIALDNWAAKNNIVPNVIKAYGDSRADRFIMGLAQHRFWINPKTGKYKK